jgi:hypothetical protein
MTEKIVLNVPGLPEPITGALEYTRPQEVLMRDNRSPFWRVVGGLEWIYYWGVVSYGINQIVRNLLYLQKMEERKLELMDWIMIIPRSIFWPLVVPLNWLTKVGLHAYVNKYKHLPPCTWMAQKLFPGICKDVEKLNKIIKQQ